MFRDQCAGVDQNAEGIQLGAGPSFFEPERYVPFRPGVMVLPGVNEAPLPTVRDQGQLAVGRAQPFHDPGHRPAAAPNAQLLLRVEEDRQTGAVRALPQKAGLQCLARQGKARPFFVHLRTFGPAAADYRTQTADLVQYGHDQAAGVLRRAALKA